MLSVFDSLRGTDYPAVLLRLLLAVCCGALIGMERSAKNRTAGLRTHILVCLAGAIAALTGHYIYLGLHVSADLTRISSQVISGMGFIGAGSILVTKNLSIKGLTTAAGLWTVSIIGIALGSGFYEGGLLVTALTIFTQTFFARVDKSIRVDAKYSLDLRCDDKTAIDEVIRLCAQEHISVRDLRVVSGPGGEGGYAAEFQVQGALLPPSLLERIRGIEGVVSLAVH